MIVTGGAGFLGSHLVDRLLAAGEDVLVVDDLCTGSRQNLEEAGRAPGFRMVDGDIVEPETARRASDSAPEVDTIYHLASRASPPSYQSAAIGTLRCGSEGTRNFLELARKHDAAFLLTSTSEVYGDPTVSPQSESYRGNVDPVGPRSMYDESKRYAESLTMAYHRTYGLDIRIARIFNTYGPRLAPGDGRVVSNFIHQALHNRPLTVYGDGSQTRSFCYVSDLVGGLEALMAQGGAQPVNLGNPTELTIHELAEEVQALVQGNVPIAYHPLPGDDPKRRRPDIRRAQETLGWSPAVPLREGLRRTMAWMAGLPASRGPRHPSSDVTTMETSGAIS